MIVKRLNATKPVPLKFIFVFIPAVVMVNETAKWNAAKIGHTNGEFHKKFPFLDIVLAGQDSCVQYIYMHALFHAKHSYAYLRKPIPCPKHM